MEFRRVLFRSEDAGAVSSDAKPAVPTQAEVLKGTDWPALRLVSGDAWIDCDVAGAPLPGTVAIVPEPAPQAAQAAVASSTARSSASACRGRRCPSPPA